MSQTQTSRCSTLTARTLLRPATAFLAMMICAGGASAQITMKTLKGNAFWGQYGTSVASIGDVDKDGTPDFAVGQPDAANNQIGKVKIYSGKTQVEIATLSGTTDAAFGTTVAGAGDVNQDGWPDVVVGSPDWMFFGIETGRVQVFSGKDWSQIWAVGGPEGGAEFGRVVAGVGDVNKDGRDDVAVSAYNADMGGATDRGMVQVLSGLNGSVIYTWTGTAAYGHFGWSIAGIGDMNGNGYPDIAIGAPDDGQSGFHAGLVTVKDGSNGGVIWSGTGSQSGGKMGTAVSGADVNGDGYMDVVIGASGEANEFGRVKVVPGPWGGAAIWTATGDAMGDGFGTTVAGVGDINKDGKGDVMVGAPQVFTGNGYARILSGKNATTLWSTMTGEESGSRFGIAVCGLGDLDKDGWLEVAIGAPDHDQSGVVNAGAVRVVRVLVEQQNLGFGGPGASQLRMYGGALSSGNTADLRLQFAPVNNPVFLIASGSAGYTPYKLGVIVPSVTPSVIVPLMSNQVGEVFIPGIPGGYGNFAVYAQAIIPAPTGFQFSNALKIQLLP